MSLWLVEMLRVWGWKVPAVFDYCSTRMFLAALTTLSCSIFLGPRFITALYSLKMGQPIRKEDCPLLGQLHEKKENTPTMGGMLILGSLLFSMVLWMDWSHSFTWIFFFSLLVLGALGARDDWLKLRHRTPDGLAGRRKLLIQVTLAIALASYLFFPAVQQLFPCQPPEALSFSGEGSEKLLSPAFFSHFYLPFFKDPIWVLSGWGGVGACLFYMFVIAGSSNAVNLTDGLDGLAAGHLILVAFTLSVFAFLSNHIEIAHYLHILYIEGAGEIGIFLSGLCGACLGFLWYNGHPAQVFMGDTGSLSLGGLIGIAAILLRREFLLALVGGVFVAEALSVIIQVASYKLRGGKRVFLCAPLHHHFEYRGWPETKVTLRFWIVGLLLAIVGLASLKFQ